MDIEKTALGLIGPIYDSATEPAKWQLTVELLSKAYQSNLSILGVHDFSRNCFASMHSAGKDALAMSRQYFEEFVQHDPFPRLVFTCPTLEPLSVDSVMSVDEFRKSKIYADFYGPQDLEYMHLVKLYFEWPFSSNFAQYRPRATGDFDSEHYALSRIIGPHLQRAQQLQYRLATAERNLFAADAALDRLNIGVLFVDSTGEVIYVNARAEEILNTRDGLSIANKRLSAARSDDTARLNGLMRQAAAVAAGRSIDPVAQLSLPKPSGKRPLSVLIAPLTGSSAWPARGTPTATVFLSDPDDDTPLSGEVLQALYQFTPKEAELAQHLADGLGAMGAAARMGVTENTVRTHLKSIFAKTGTSKQSELVKMLVMGPSGLREDAAAPSQH